MKYRGGTAAMNLSVDVGGGQQQQLTADFVAELKEFRRQISPSHKTGIKDVQMAAPMIHPASGSRRSPVISPVPEHQSTGRRQTFAGQKSLSCEVNQFVQYQPSGPGTERLRDYLDENEIKEFEIEDADGTGVSVWVPPATLSDRSDATQASRLGVPTAGRRASRIGGQRRAHFAEQRSFSCEAASSTPARTKHRETQHVPGHADDVGRRYARDSNLRLVRQSKTETPDAVKMPATSAIRDSTQSRRRDRDAEAGGAVYRSHHHQATETVVEHASSRSTAVAYGDGDPTRNLASGSARYGGDATDRSRVKSTKEMRPLERHSSMMSGAEERDADVTAALSGRRHTTGQMHDHRYQDSASTKNAADVRRYARPPADVSYSTERGRVLATEVDKKTSGDVVADVHRKTSPRRVEAGKDTGERSRPPATTQSVGHVTTYHNRRTGDLHDRDR